MLIFVDLPTYLYVADELESALADQPAGTRVASEHELARTHSISRLTARAVLDELEQRHVVRRRRGSGTFVVRRYDYVVTNGPTPSWSEIVRSAGGHPRAEVLAMSTVDDPPDGLDGGTLRLDRLCWVNAERALYKTSWLTPATTPGLIEALPLHESLFAALDKAYGLNPLRTTARAELIRPPGDVAEALELRRNTEVIAVQTITHSRRLDKPVEITQSWLRTELFRLVIDLS